MARHTPDVSVLGPRTRVTGRITGRSALRIEGALRGDVQVTGRVEVAEGGSVEGNVQAASLEVSGSLLGDVESSGPVSIRSGAVVRGELRGAAVSIEPGARVAIRLDTELDLELGPTKRK